MDANMQKRNMKKGTGSEQGIKILGEYACREVPVPLFQQAADPCLTSGDEDLASIVDELAERLRHGEKLDWPACLRQHPRHAEALKEIAPALEVLVNFRQTGQ